MHRLGPALLLACLLAPAALADDGDAWWATPAAEAEVDNGWWHRANEDVAFEGAPDAPAAVTSAVLPVATQSVPSFAAAKTGPGCDADTGVCDESDALDAGAGQFEASGAENADGTSLPAEGDRAEADPASDQAGSNAAPTSVAPEEDEREAPHNCERYSKQIYRYMAEAEYAEKRGNERAVQGLEAQIQRLMAQMDRRCPLPPPKDHLKAMLRTLAKLGKLALTAAKYGLI